MRKYNLAVVGVTGAVGEEILEVLQEVDFPIANLIPLASARSVGQIIEFGDFEYPVLELTETCFDENDVEIALFSAGGSISAKYAPFAVEAGAVVIDNTSHFRMDSDIPLVVPEVNPEAISLWQNRGIIANPNCSTIQMVQALKPLDSEYGILRVDVSTYQATSGAGKKAMEELVSQMKDFFDFKLADSPHQSFNHQIALNVIPQIDKFMESDYTKEEEKMVFETRKILNKDIEVSATCVRVPVLRGHSENITITFEKDIEADEVREILRKSPNIIVIDNPEEESYPMPIISTDRNDTFIGRIRKDLYRNNMIHLWVVADNLRVGAATNAVRIAEKWIESEEENE
jgi:aspartate-semialdehyde dehydrogenase